MYVNFTLIVDFSHSQCILTSAKYIEVFKSKYSWAKQLLDIASKV